MSLLQMWPLAAIPSNLIHVCCFKYTCARMCARTRAHTHTHTIFLYFIEYDEAGHKGQVFQYGFFLFARS